jgi:hypothetical protein
VSLDPSPTATGTRADAAPGVLDRATALLRIYTRAFLAQGVGLVGLAWCLVENLPWVALGLTALVLIDQAVFLRGRAALPGAPRLQAWVDLWCLGVSAADILILFAALFRAAGLRDGSGAAVTDPLSCLAFAVATLARLDLGLLAANGAGRLLAALEALLGDIALIGAVAALLNAAWRRSTTFTWL